MTRTTLFTTLDSPVGPLLVAAREEATGEGAIMGLFMNAPRDEVVGNGWIEAEDDPLLARAAGQLAEFFRGERRAFDLPLAPGGTAFQGRVWEELRRIPYGETVSYGELARRIGAPGASRAVGMANGANPISILIPCHRVIGSSGRLTGYGGGVERKAFLLDLERGGSSRGLFAAGA